MMKKHQKEKIKKKGAQFLQYWFKVQSRLSWIGLNDYNTYTD